MERLGRFLTGWVLPIGLGWWGGALLVRNYYSGIIYSAVWPPAIGYAERRTVAPVLCALIVLIVWRLADGQKGPVRGAPRSSPRPPMLRIPTKPAAKRTASGTIGFREVLLKIERAGERVAEVEAFIGYLILSVIGLCAGAVIIFGGIFLFVVMQDGAKTNEDHFWSWWYGGFVILFGAAIAWTGFRLVVATLAPRPKAPKKSDALGGARTATMDELRRKGILK